MNKVLSVTVSVLFACVFSCPLLFVEDAVAFGGSVLPLESCGNQWNECVLDCEYYIPDAQPECISTCNSNLEVCLEGDNEPLEPTPFSEDPHCDNLFDLIVNPQTPEIHLCSLDPLIVEAVSSCQSFCSDDYKQNELLALLEQCPGRPTGVWYNGNKGGVSWDDLFYLGGGWRPETDNTPGQLVFCFGVKIKQ